MINQAGFHQMSFDLFQYNIVLILHGDEGYIGKFYPEYHFLYRVAPSQLKKPRGIKSDMRVKFSDIA